MIKVGREYRPVPGSLTFSVIAIGQTMAWCYGDNSFGEYHGGECPVPIRFLEECEQETVHTGWTPEDTAEGLAKLKQFE